MLEHEVHCSGCPNVMKEGEVVFGREVGRVKADGVSMLPLDYIYCAGCARTVLNMSMTEVASAIVDIDARTARW